LNGAGRTKTGLGVMSEVAGAGAWYAAVLSLADQAEELANATATYVDTAFLVTLANRRNQVVLGGGGRGRRICYGGCRMSWRGGLVS